MNKIEDIITAVEADLDMAKSNAAYSRGCMDALSKVRGLLTGEINLAKPIAVSEGTPANPPRRPTATPSDAEKSPTRDSEPNKSRKDPPKEKDDVQQ